MHRQLTIYGSEAWESQFTGKHEGRRVRCTTLVILASDDMGILVITVDEINWGEFEGIWEKIRDSVEFTP